MDLRPCALKNIRVDAVAFNAIVSLFMTLNVVTAYLLCSWGHMDASPCPYVSWSSFVLMYLCPFVSALAANLITHKQWHTTISQLHHFFVPLNDVYWKTMSCVIWLGDTLTRSGNKPYLFYIIRPAWDAYEKGLLSLYVCWRIVYLLI